MRDIEQYQKEYIKNDFESKYQVPFRRKKLLDIIQRGGYRKILEIGCGMDPLAAYVEEFDEYTIVEPGKEFLENAKKVLHGRKKITYVYGYFEDKIDEISQSAYDLIIVSSLLHEVDDPERLLNAVRAVSTTQTVVHINVPNACSIYRILAYEAGIIPELKKLTERNRILQQNRVFDMESLEQLIGKTGRVEICEKGSYFVKPFSHAQMLKCVEQGIIDENILEALYKLTAYLPEYGSEIYVNYRYTK